MLEGKHVLALEDEPVVAFLIEDMLLDAGAKAVTVASRIAEACAAVARGGIEAAVLDVNVHGEQSYAVADQLAAIGVPFVFASGYGDGEHPPRYAEAPTLTKPFSAHELSRAFDGLEEPTR
jgi:CheY-like chemotaxis protein